MLTWILNDSYKTSELKAFSKKRSARVIVRNKYIIENGEITHDATSNNGSSTR